jgi:hypothetical protein
MAPSRTSQAGHVERNDPEASWLSWVSTVIYRIGDIVYGKITQKCISNRWIIYLFGKPKEYHTQEMITVGRAKGR